MSFFSSLFKRKKAPKAPPVTRSAPAEPTRSAPGSFADKANELRHNARTGDPRLGSHRSGRIDKE